ncbi:MAG: 5'-nucleotidase C-terminal domain-containing protein [Pegethrix bostrychoides GSE-TBD4-15B]|jgi:2',3'-cyclic-nucleotide 2'-phosphodiesterase (5'-nucleotidase family)|uniref:5'-nucleotidase C-terminal domain-containing protein n=1 Tax=Pegethrix bostrychoides GSE-TBD4-15B TaxID=2839662 RepID=A0A951P970_9CYAN|nr:5'-nucleotidase C-terminal domain-containing protein [Pegethrix bostrychoides GSE-TBD4-15B]
MPTSLQLLHASDFEAGIPALEDSIRFSALVNYFSNPVLGSTGQFGIPTATVENTLILSSGDNFLPGPFFNASSDPSLNGVGGLTSSSAPTIGRADIGILNAIGIQASAFGNHEFDLGTRQVRDLLRSGSGNPGTNFPYLSSNLDFSTDENLSSLVAANPNTAEASTLKNQIAESTVITLDSGEKIGIVGATTPTLRSISSPGDVGILPANPVDYVALAAEIQKSVDLLKATGINKIILLAHMQQLNIERDELAPRLRDVDIIIAGGSHTPLLDDNDIGRTDGGNAITRGYPVVRQDAAGQTTLVLNTDANYRYLGRLVVEFDDQGLIDLTKLNNVVNGAFSADEAGVDRVYGLDVNPRDVANPNVVAISDGLKSVISSKDNTITGSTEFFLNGTRTDVRSQETNLGNLTADANISYVRQIDPTVTLSLKNGGGIRDNIGSISASGGGTSADDFTTLPPQPNPLAPNKQVGDVSQLDIENSLRFNNGLSLITVTASQLKELLENGVSGVRAGATPGAFPQVGGLRFSFDATKTAQVLAADGTVTTPGSRIQSLVIVNDKGRIIDTVVENGALVGDASRSYRMVTLNFLAGSTTTSGGDGYPFARFVRENSTLANRIDLTGETTVDLNGNGVIDAPAAIPAGQFTFAATGSEQDALAEYLAETGTFMQADTPAAEDTRIQNIAVRGDTVLQGGRLIEGSSDADNLTGTLEDDTLLGRGGSDSLRGRAGADELEGGVGADRLVGNKGDDLLMGGRGRDTLRGNADNDTLVGGLGSDILNGGGGNDLFVLEIGSGVDLIQDFSRRQDNRDKLALSEGIRFNRLTIEQVGDDTRITLGQDRLAILQGIEADSLSQRNFVTFELASV